MRLFITYLAFCCVGAVFGDAPVATAVGAAGLATHLNPYYAGRNPFGAGYSPYYNSASATAPILTYSNEHGIDGSYSYSFTTGDGKQAQESGFLKDAYIDNTGAPQGTQVKEGSFGYTSPEGIPIQVNYVADENGFRHGGVHIPADGKSIPSSLINGLNGGQFYDPRYNLNSLYNHRNRLGQFGQYNPLTQFDARNPYNSRFNH